MSQIAKINCRQKPGFMSATNPRAELPTFFERGGKGELRVVKNTAA
jgi:hypothetical protein